MQTRMTGRIPAVALALACLAAAPLAGQQRLAYPETQAVDHADEYFGERVADPYRWLEDDTASATRAWVQAQNAVTFGYLERIPFRARLRQRLEQLFNYPKIGAPSHRGPWYTFSRNEGLQNQSVLYIQRGLDGAPEVLIDPNTLSTDGTTRLGAAALSRDGRYFGYGLSVGGSDWQEYRVMEVAGRRTLDDRIRWVKVSSLAWRGDGFYYSRYPAPADTTKALSGRNADHMVYYHRLGTPQEQDELVYEDKANPQRFHLVSVTDDERIVALSISDRGRGKDGNALHVRDLGRGETAFRPIVTDFEFSHDLVDHVDGKLLVYTNRDAPNYKVVLIDPATPAPAAWRTVIPEGEHVLDGVSFVGGRLIATYRKDAAHQVVVYRLDGSREREVRLPGIGLVSGFNGERDDQVVFYTFSSFTVPPTTYKYDVRTGQSTLYRQATVPFDASAYETRQVFYPSKDGTRIPMFIVAKKGLRLDGQRPTLIYGYGGFNISLGPSFNPLVVALLEQGGVYAQPSLRGGGEYGERWHQAGMKLNKQNVFDDFIAAAEWLQANGYTSPARCAWQGGSNGGLLVGAMMTQRPELCRVALPAVGVMDMLRYQKFTIGWNWAADYGTSEESPEMFRYLRGYSPLHNLKPGTDYPATMVTTADHDDRVVPAHSFKFAATLQRAHAGTTPVLIRIETKSGHGAVSTAKRLDETADLYAFMMQNMGVEPVYAATP